MTTTTKPHEPSETTSEESTATELEFARRQGEAFDATLRYMIEHEAHGSELVAGDYRVGYAVEHAEGLYSWHGGELCWKDPDRENAHIEISVRDAAEGRFLPGLRVLLTVLAADGTKLGQQEQPFLWHPWLYHYGRNWTLPGDGEYTLRIHIDPPTWQRHDLKNGNRFRAPVDVEFPDVRIETGRKCSRDDS